MTRRPPINDDRVARDVVNRDSRRRVDERLSMTTRREAVRKNLLWLLERIDDDPDGESIDRTVRTVLRRFLYELHDSELLSLLVEDPSSLTGHCRVCGRELKPAKRGRPPEHCGSACRQKSYRRRINPNAKLSIRTVWLAEILEETVEELAHAESKALQNQILRSQMAKIESRQRHRRGKRVAAAVPPQQPSESPQPRRRAPWSNPPTKAPLGTPRQLKGVTGAVPEPIATPTDKRGARGSLTCQVIGSALPRVKCAEPTAIMPLR